MAHPAPLIAVVDDEAAVRTMLRRVLRMAEYDVVAFASGEEFLASLSSRLPACAVLDVHMPGLSGLHVGAQVRTAGLALPFVFITASEDVRLEGAASATGAVALLHKPFSSDALLEAIRRALDT